MTQHIRLCNLRVTNDIVLVQHLFSFDDMTSYLYKRLVARYNLYANSATFFVQTNKPVLGPFVSLQDALDTYNEIR